MKCVGSWKLGSVTIITCRENYKNNREKIPVSFDINCATCSTCFLFSVTEKCFSNACLLINYPNWLKYLLENPRKIYYFVGVTFAYGYEYEHRKSMKNPPLTLKQIISLILKAIKQTNNLICKPFDYIIPIKLIILQIQKCGTSALVSCSHCLFIQSPKRQHKY